jgi:hypothetical protein
MIIKAKGAFLAGARIRKLGNLMGWRVKMASSCPELIRVTGVESGTAKFPNVQPIAHAYSTSSGNGPYDRN